MQSLGVRDEVSLYISILNFISDSKKQGEHSGARNEVSEYFPICSQLT
jgi:hypothetical protein